jgi:hypothetical protein
MHCGTKNPALTRGHRGHTEGTRGQISSGKCWISMSGWLRPSGTLHYKKTPKFDGVTFWTVFHRQFVASAVQNSWTANVKTAHLLCVLQRYAADFLHTVAAEAKYEDIVGVLQDRLLDHQLASAYQMQHRPGCQGGARRCKCSTVEPVAHRFLGLPC